MAAPGRPGAPAAGSPLGNAAAARAGAAPGAGAAVGGLGNAAAARVGAASGAGAPTAGPTSPVRQVAAPVDESVRAARAQRAAEAIRRRELRQLAERDRPLEPSFKWEPLGDPDHVVELKGHPRLDLADIQALDIVLSDDPVSIPVRFASLAWGRIRIAGSFEGFQTFHTPQPQVITLDHPGLLSLDESSIPALLVEVRGGWSAAKS